MAVVQVVKYNGGPNVFAWKYPSEQLGTWTQVIVNESQEAVLFKGGQALDVMGPGRHTLTTANIPVLGSLVNLPFGGRSPFAAEVWFINRAQTMNVKWGTPTPIQVQDPKYQVFVPVRSFGQFAIQIEDSTTFLTKLVGTLPVFDESNISAYFRGIYLTKVRDALANYVGERGIGIFEISAHSDELSDHLRGAIGPTLAEYGIGLVNFYVNDISVPEDDTAVMKLKGALAKRAEMDVVGYSYVQERSFDTLEGAATNPGSNQSGLMGAGIGLGMGVGLGGALGGQFGGLAQNLNINETQACGACGTQVAALSKFCPECGAAPGRSCRGCAASISSQAKFCPECGVSTSRMCPSCGTAVDGNPKFCPECGSGQES